MHPHDIIITSLNGARDLLTSDKAQGLHAVVSLGHQAPGREEQGEQPPTGYKDFGSNGRQVKLRINTGDIRHLHEGWEKYVPDRQPPEPKHIEALLEFFPKIEGPVLFHCYAGRSRSPAAALIYLAWALGPGKEAEAVARLKTIREYATPNHLMVAYADVLLGHGRQLYDAMLISRGSHIYPELQIIYRQAKALIQGTEMPWLPTRAEAP